MSSPPPAEERRNLPGGWGKVKQLRGFPGLTLARAPDKFVVLPTPQPGRDVTPETVHRVRALPRVGAVTAALLMGLTACDEDPFVFRWNATPDTVRIYSLARPEPNLPSGFGFLERSLIRVETPGATGTWDVALDTENGALVLKPPGALGITARAGIASLGAVPFDDVDVAPGDTLLYELDDPVVMETGRVYAIRTNRRTGNFGSTCVYYGKLEPLTVDATAGEMEFRYVRSEVCNNRSLVPPD